MEAIKLKLTENEVGGLLRYLATLPDSFDPAVLILLEFQERLWKRALVHRLNRKPLFVYSIPASAAVVLWRRWQNEAIESALQLILVKLDSVLTNRGMKDSQSKLLK